MNVLLIGDYPPPLGGIAVHVKQLHAYFLGEELNAQVLDIGKGVARHPDVIPAKGLFSFVRELYRPRPEELVVHLHTSGNNRKSWLVAAACAKAPGMSGPPRVLTLHSGLLPAYLRGSATRRIFAKAVLKGYQRIIAVSDAVKDGLVEAGASADRIQVLPAFCASRMVPGPLPAGFERVRRRRAPLIAMAHHPSKIYGRRVMLAALRVARTRYPDIGLAVFGPGAQSPDLWAEAKSLGVEGLIENFGELPHETALAVISEADAFVRPTTADGDAISVREALALKVPCVASDAAARPLGTYVFKAGDPADLVERLSEALARGCPEVAPVDAGPILVQLYRSVLRAESKSPVGNAVLQPIR